MDIKVKPGKYVIAVSGGVDSMVLLDILSRQANVELIVAHFNHGIRADSGQDERLVTKTAKKYQLPLEVGRGRLGPKNSEDKARQARYRFLREVRDKYQADSIITAHHQDDLIETALLNLLRGTGVKGLNSLAANPEMTRPMLKLTKKQVLDYAARHRITWREDSTNQDLALLRNYVRQRLVPKLKEVERVQLLQKIDKVAKIDKQTQQLIATISHIIDENGQIQRQKFAALPTEVAEELILYWLRQQHAPDPDRRTVRRLHLALKTALPNTIHQVRKGLWLEIERRQARFTTTVPSGVV